MNNRLPLRQLPPPDVRPAVTVDGRGLHIVLTCDLSLPPGVIQEMAPLPNGMTLLKTDRGTRRVREPYHKIVAVLARIREGVQKSARIQAAQGGEARQ